MRNKEAPPTALGLVSRLGLALLLLLVSAAPAAAAIGLLTSGSAAGTNIGNTSGPFNVTVNLTTGDYNTVVVVVAVKTTTIPPTSIEDSAGSVYQLQADVTANSTSSRVRVYSTPAGASKNSTWVRANVNCCTGTDMVVAVAVYSGVVSLGQTATLPTNSSTPATLSLTIQDGNNWVVAGFAGQGTSNPSTASTGNMREHAVANGTIGGFLTDNWNATAGTSVTNAVNLTGPEWTAMAALELRTAPSPNLISSGTGSGSSTTSCNAPVSTVRPGDTMVVIVAMNPTTTTVQKIQDNSTQSLSSTYSLQRAQNSPGSNTRIEIWAAPTIASTATGTVTVTLNASIGKLVCAAADYAGVTGGIGTTSTASGTTANPSIALTTQDANNIVVAGFATQGTTLPTQSTNGYLRATRASSGGSSSTNVAATLTDNTKTTATSVTNAVTLAATQWAAVALELRTKVCGTVTDPTYVAANAQIASGQTNVYWSSPTYPNVLVVRKPGKFTGEVPNNYQNYALTATGGSLGTAAVSYVGSATSDPDTPGAGNYYYKVFAYDTSTGPTCYSSGTVVNPTDGTSANTALAAPHVWSYAMANGSMMKPGIAGWDGTINTSSLAARMIALDTGSGAQKWAATTTAAVQGWLNWLPTNSPLAYWKFDDGTGTTAADSSGTSPGTLTNGPTWTTGKIGQALSFNGTNQYVDVTHKTAFNAYPLSVAAWIKTSASTAGGIVNKYAASSFNGWNLFTNSGNLCAWYFTGSSTTNYVYDGTLCPFNVTGYNDNQWHHVVFTVDASGGKLYVDGVQRGSTQAWAGTAQATTTTQNISVGQYPGNASPYFNGLVDEVRLHTRALSAAEVSALYATTAASTATVFGADQGGTVYALDTVSGVKSWQVTLTGAEAIQAPTSAQLRAYSNPAFTSAPLFANTTDVILAASYNTTITPCGTPSTNNRLFAIRPSDGAVLWTFNSACTSTVDYISGMPAVDYNNNRIFVGAHAGSTGTQTSFYVINSLDGTQLGSVPNLGHLDSSPSPSYNGNRIYVGNTAAKLYAINNAVPPTLRWTLDLTTLGASSSAAVKGFIWEDFNSNYNIYPHPLYLATSDGKIWCVKDNDTSAAGCAATGWPVAVSGPSTPLEMGGYLYVGSSDGNLYEINLGTNPLVVKSLVVGDGTAAVGDVSTDDGNGSSIFVGTNAGRIYKIQIPLP